MVSNVSVPMSYSTFQNEASLKITTARKLIEHPFKV